MAATQQQQESHAGARHFCRIVRTRVEPARRGNVFVAGCGLGHEALHIRKELDVPVTGVDITQQWETDLGAGTDRFTLLQGSILDLPFPDATFDLVFYHHVIEHVSDPARSVAELHRILVPGGFIYVGTPNRHRAIGYLGSPDATRWEKIKWNTADYRARLRGEFRNECGAHAGFTERELADLLAKRFHGIESLTADYLCFKYARLPKATLNLVCATPMIGVAAPSVYALARKRDR